MLKNVKLLCAALAVASLNYFGYAGTEAKTIPILNNAKPAYTATPTSTPVIANIPTPFAIPIPSSTPVASETPSPYNLYLPSVQNKFHPSNSLDDLASLPIQKFSFAEWSIKGINYMDSENTWERMWTSFNYNKVNSDLELARKLNVNTLRIFVQHKAFGGMSLKPEMANNLISFLDIAYNKKMNVIVTLLDGGPGDFCNMSEEYAIIHSAAVVSAIKNHPAILMYDLKNEPNCNGSLTKELVEKLRYISNVVRIIDSKTPQTIGLLEGDFKMVSDIIGFTDVAQIHSYSNHGNLEEILSSVIKQANGKPVLLGEFGKPLRHFSSGKLTSVSAEEQARYYEQVIKVARKLKISGALFWTLMDFNDKQIIASAENLSQFGIYDAQGNERPAARIISDAFKSQP